jgi:hypothetical protein
MNIDLYQTSSLSLATALIVSSTAKLDFIDKSNSSRAVFVFKRSKDLDKIIELYWQKKLPCDCSTYFDALKYLKSRLYEESI